MARARGSGSSPLTRGKHHDVRREVLVIGLIPAHAGKTQFSSQFFYRKEAHPRSRGENLGVSMGALTVMGSSPLTRGKPSDGGGEAGALRLIPAHAGKTKPRQASRSPRAAHPRSRGENLTVRRDPPSRPGSSPLTRGKQGNKAHGAGDRRLIPAHAGKTLRQGN